ALAPAALGIVRTSGKDCIQLLSKVFSRPKALLQAPGNTLVYGWIKDGDSRIDEVMLAIYKAPKSFTGEDMVEIFCHGGPAVVTAIQNLMLKSGFRAANRGEYTFRAFINGKTDLTKAEAVKEIIDSHTDASRSHAVGRLAGSLFEEIDSIKKLIIDTLAAIEVEIEYPEDEETIADSFDKTDLETAQKRLKSLVDSWKSEKLYQDGARVVLAGRTNAGKSSLFNAILKEERAIVSDIEGTTRDWLESWASINGIPVRLFDTAGLRQTDDVIEARGVELTKNLATDADVVLYLIDSTVGPNDDDKTFIQNCTEPLIVVYNKADKNQGGGSLPLAPKSSPENLAPVFSATPSESMSLSGLTRQSPIYISAKTGSGLKDLFAQITKILTAGLSTEREQAGLGSARQKTAVQEALECVEHALESAQDNYTLDAVVQDLEDSLDALGEVTGDVTPDDVLGSIFANFCVGK
ncbi:MAG: tRNA uridine-5-carboxymethylaminomethyl(34) synthesis GTPase MnmE, partial [Treponema sp.]|nr:tRNA uridine-5-carboxymethylaminomethyl(34) synthesis GTPase MnmE [Treponema sp.]